MFGSTKAGINNAFILKLSITPYSRYLMVVALVAIVSGLGYSMGDSRLLQESRSLSYLFLGHIYHWQTAGNKVDKRLETFNMAGFDQVWLGGDICSETTKQPETVSYIDNLFDVGKPGNFWTLGNHDIRNGKLGRITSRTGRNTYYTEYLNGITVVVLNTNFDEIHKDDSTAMCAASMEQYRFLDSVLDTVKASSHLILLMHHVIWEKKVDPYHWTYTNYYKKDWRFFCDSNATFDNVVYPRLVRIQERGVKVICVAGDSGTRDWGINKKYGHKRTREGVNFLASGINNSKYNFADSAIKDKVLIFNHIPENEDLTWGFHDLDSLIAATGPKK